MNIEVKKEIGIGWKLMVDGKTKDVFDSEDKAQRQKAKLEKKEDDQAI